jgi:hypothetical protein
MWAVADADFISTYQLMQEVDMLRAGVFRAAAPPRASPYNAFAQAR